MRPAPALGMIWDPALGPRNRTSHHRLGREQDPSLVTGRALRSGPRYGSTAPRLVAHSLTSTIGEGPHESASPDDDNHGEEEGNSGEVRGHIDCQQGRSA